MQTFLVFGQPYRRAALYCLLEWRELWEHYRLLALFCLLVISNVEVTSIFGVTPVLGVISFVGWRWLLVKASVVEEMLVVWLISVIDLHYKKFYFVLTWAWFIFGFNVRMFKNVLIFWAIWGTSKLSWLNLIILD